MKQHFLKLFGYDYYANELILKATLETGSPDQAVKLMAHTLAAQQVWLARCKQHTNAPGNPIWPDDLKADEQLIINHQNNQNWMQFLESENLDIVITYKNSTGVTFNNSITDILTHLINHGTHHRAQAGQIIKNLGFKLPNTDYIMYLRNK
jgi:uncharacterized damage-inducible protein DinB